MKLPAGAKQSEVFDAIVPAFGVRLSTTTKTFFVCARDPNKKKLRVTIGRYPDVSLLDARRKATEIQEQVKGGTYQSQKEKAAEVTQSGAVIGEAEGAEQTTPSFAAMVSFYIEQKKGKLRERSNGWKNLSYQLNRYFIEVIGEKLITEVKESDFQEIIDDIMADDKPGAANHAVADIKRCFNWLIDRKHRNLIKIHFKWEIGENELKESPVASLSKPHQYKPRTRVLSIQELGVIYRAAEQMVNDGIATEHKTWVQYGGIMRLLILTGARRGQIAESEWEKIDTAEKCLVTRSKQRAPGKVLLIPLTDTTLGIFNSIERKEECPYVFWGAETSPFSNFNDGLTELKLRCGSHERDTESEKLRLLWAEDWVPHDIRRSISTTFAAPKQGVPQQVTEALLDHKLSSGAAHSQIAAIYNQYEYAVEKREALTKWEELVMKEVAAVALKKGQMALAA